MALFRNASLLLGATALTVPVGFVTSVVLARYLDVADRGLFHMAANFAATLFVVGQLGWAANSVFQIRSAGRVPSEVAGAALFSVGLYCLFALPLVIWFGAPLTAAFLPDAAPLVLWLCLATMPLQLVSMVCDGLARGLDRFDLGSVNRAAQTLGRFAAIGAALVVMGGGLSDALSAVLVVWGVTTLWFASRVLRLTGVSFPSGSGVREMARFGGQSHLLTFVTRMHERADVLLLAYLLADPAPNGYYAIALTIPAVLSMVPESVSVAAYTALAGEGSARAVELTSFVVRNILVWVVALCLAFASVAGWLLPWAFGDAYSAAVVPSLWLAVAIAPAAVHRVIMRYLVAFNRQGTTLTIYTVALAVNLVLNVAMIPHFGIEGAAVARVISQTVCALALVAVFRRQAGAALRTLLIPQATDLEAYRRRLSSLMARIS